VKLASLKPRDVAAYLLDRADQYETESPCWIALADAAENVLAGEVHRSLAENDFDDALYARVDGMAGRVKSVEPTLGVDDES